MPINVIFCRLRDEKAAKSCFPLRYMSNSEVNIISNAVFDKFDILMHKKVRYKRCIAGSIVHTTGGRLWNGPRDVRFRNFGQNEFLI